jgi:hypothetical protein
MIVGYSMVLYGKDYLAYALRSLRDYVDRHVIIYSDAPTFGSHTTLPCPDTRDELKTIALEVLREKLVWVEGMPQNYESVMTIFPSTELILEVDADEVWTPNLLANALRNWHSDSFLRGSIRIPMVHHWRSFDYVCRDQSWPIRLYNNKSGIGKELVLQPTPDDVIHHFGYARALSDMRYKIETSAHRGEWRAGWWDDVFMRFPSRLNDLHPVVEGMWRAEPYDKSCLPDFMREHPYYNKEVIE